jgi:hypothetical protein
MLVLHFVYSVRKRVAEAGAIESVVAEMIMRFGVDLQPFRTDPEINRLYAELFGS